MPLSEFAKITSTVAPIAVDHQGQFASVTLSFNLPPNVSIGAAVSAIQQATKELHLPASIATSFQGSAQAFQNSLSSLFTTPVVYIYMDRLGTTLRRLRGSRRGVEEAPAVPSLAE